MTAATVLEPRSPATHDAVVRAAVAEALHVDGRYRDSARLWIELVEEEFETAICALKAAVAFYSAGSDRLGDTWLAHARAAGLPEGELVHVEAQRARLAGDLERARLTFEHARALEPAGSSEATNALGATLWQLADACGAARCFSAALERNPRDGMAATNLGRIAFEEGRDAEAALALARGAALAPHRPEPFVLYSRLLRRRGDLEGAREALIKARLRRPIAADRPEPPTRSAPAGSVDVRARIRQNGISITARYEFDGACDLPTHVVLNPGYEDVTFAASPSAKVRDLYDTADDAGHLRAIRIPENAVVRDGERRIVELQLEGVPTPPCVRLDETWFELGAESGWIPFPSPAVPRSWKLELDLPPGFRAVRSTDGPSANGVGLIALHEPERVGVVAGNVSCRLLETAAGVATRALKLWDPLAGPLDRPCPPIIVLDRPQSTFCYARPGFVRLASGILQQRGQSAIIYHEIAHLWWGVGARFEPRSAWLAEALAEYALHLAEDDGTLDGYRDATLDTLCGLGNAELPATRMIALARASGHDAATILRAKGAFLISMLREVIGPSHFASTLQAALNAGNAHPLDAYTFFALASWFHGATLDWFVNQWVFADGAMTFDVDGVRVERASTADDHNAGFDLRFAAHSRGVATPGAPVELAIALEGGGEERVQVSLDNGHAEVGLTCSARPFAITIDPDRRWYATVPSRTTRIDS